MEGRYSQRIRLDTAVTGALVAGFVGMRLWRLTGASLGGDEIFSLYLARRDWSGLLAGAIQDAVHPPLFYALLKLWVGAGGESLLWLRLFPLLASVLGLIPFFLWCRKLAIPHGARNLALAIAAVHPYALFYDQYVRMYCLLMLGGMLSAWLFQNYLDQPSRRNLALLTAANLVLVYVHYYGWLVVGVEFLCLILLRRRLKGFALSIGLTAAVFAPWAWVAGRTLRARGLAENLGWVPRPGLREFLWFYVDLTGCADIARVAVLGTVIVFAFLLTQAWRGRMRERLRGRLFWPMLLWMAPPPIAFLVSRWLPQSIWGHRHLVFTLWPLLMVLAEAIWALPATRRAAALAAVGVWGAAAVAFHPVDDRTLPWDVLTLSLLDHQGDGTGRVPLYSLDPSLPFPIEFFLDCLKTGRTGPLGPRLGRNADLPELAAKAQRFEIMKIGKIGDAKGNEFWIGASSPSSTPDPIANGQMIERPDCKAQSEVTARDHFQAVTWTEVECRGAE